MWLSSSSAKSGPGQCDLRIPPLLTFVPNDASLPTRLAHNAAGNAIGVRSGRRTLLGKRLPLFHLRERRSFAKQPYSSPNVRAAAARTDAGATQSLEHRLIFQPRYQLRFLLLLRALR